jgi:hypothetical protein
VPTRLTMEILLDKGEIGDRVGQGQISTTLDVYTHVLLSPEEISEDAYRAALVVSPWCLD